MTENLSARFLRTVGRHFVTLSCMQTPPKSTTEHVVLFSGFVVAIDDVWFYVTAGHILRFIRSSLAAGSKFDIWRLGDQTARGQFEKSGIPFDFVDDEWIVIEDEEVGLDYAALPLRDLYHHALKVGGIVPIEKNAWSDHTTDYDQWVLVGVPTEFVTYDGRSLITAKVVGVALEEAEEPEMAGAKAKNQFYGRLTEGSEAVVKNVAGMSGGPIFATKKVDQELKYSVIGIQSAWYPSNRIIAACPFSSLGLGLEKALQIAGENHDSAHLSAT